MTSILFTIGFAQKTAEQFFRLLEDASVNRVVDIRENRIGQLSAFAKYPDIEFFLGRLLKIEYAYEALLAPSPEIREAYKATRDWPQYETSFLALMEQRGLPASLDLSPFVGRVALLCSEPGPEKCHRRLVAEMLVQYGRTLGEQFEVEHLVLAPVRRAPKRKRRPDAGADAGPNAGIDPV